MNFISLVVLSLFLDRVARGGCKAILTQQDLVQKYSAIVVSVHRGQKSGFQTEGSRNRNGNGQFSVALNWKRFHMAALCGAEVDRFGTGNYCFCKTIDSQLIELGSPLRLNSNLRQWSRSVGVP